MSYTVEDFEFDSASDCEETHLECPYDRCYWRFEIRTYFHGLGDVLDAAQKHLLEKHSD